MKVALIRKICGWSTMGSMTNTDHVASPAFKTKFLPRHLVQAAAMKPLLNAAVDTNGTLYRNSQRL
jgi:hypothetical protein